MIVSVLLLTFNEEANLSSVFESLAWCDDIVVVDSGSTDRTIDVAKFHGARVFQRAFDNFANQRNWALDHVDFFHDWILHLDADEVLTPQFTRALELLEPSTRIDAYRVPSKLMLLGRWIRYAGMFPTYQVRLGHRERLRFVQVGHGQREDLPMSRVGTFAEPYLHYSFSHGMERWLTKHIRYAKDEAELILQYRRDSTVTKGGDDVTERRRAAKARAAKVPFLLRPLVRFCYVYFWKQGFRDGRGGLVYSLMLSIYEGMTALFIYEKLLGGSGIERRRQADDKSP